MNTANNPCLADRLNDAREELIEARKQLHTWRNLLAMWKKLQAAHPNKGLYDSEIEQSRAGLREAMTRAEMALGSYQFLKIRYQQTYGRKAA